ncbi:C40 family peptidase [Flintibacter sp. P01028]|uniref:C40 family peptidase n=1 Tax=Flintibacter sp. P01028 TaxID=3342382 RepID=UPI0035B6461D
MKWKPNRPGPEGEPRPKADKGSPSRAGAEATSGQNVQKSKFRQKSKQEQAAASKLRMEKRGERLEQAKDKLSKQKPPKKPGPVRRAGRAAGGTVHSFVHGKLFEVEQENVGTEGTHRSELAGETALRHGSRFVKRKVREHPAKAVQWAESKYIKATADHQFRVAAQEHPELEKNAWKRFWQKRQYRKQAGQTARAGTAKAAQKTAAATEKAGAQAVGFIKRHPVGVLLALACVLLLFMVQSCSSSLVMLGNSGVGAVGATTYPSKDEDILGAEATYADMEAELQNYLDAYESTHDYDEYHFDLDGIEHDPYVLISILSVLHEGEWTLAQVQGTLEMLFDRQYILTERVVRETRYDSEGDPYSWYICYVTLENKNLSLLPLELMGEEELSRYALYMSSLGNRPDLFPESAYVGKYITNPPADYDVPEEYLGDETFAAILGEAEKYLGYPYVWGGSSPATSFDCSGFVSWVINHSGWNVGRLGAQGLYNICTPTGAPRPGDLVFFVGTYDTAGVSHCGIYVGDGMMIHCGDPISYANLNTSYWQSHFYAYGRLP